jgi:hypothetical protein
MDGNTEGDLMGDTWIFMCDDCGLVMMERARQNLISIMENELEEILDKDRGEDAFSESMDGLCLRCGGSGRVEAN